MANIPNPDQLQALQNFANANGRRWKQCLRTAWETGDYAGNWHGCDYPGENDFAFLQQVRNQFGPSWLIRFKL
jgi:hypothetical protein